MASSPITSWQIDGETMEMVTDLIFLGSKITADGDCSHEIKRHLLLGRKAMTNLDSIFKKQRHYFADKSPSSQSYGFSSSHVWTWEKAMATHSSVLALRIPGMGSLVGSSSRLVITFLPRSKRLLISWLQSPSAVIFEPPRNKVCHSFNCFPIYLP